MQTGSYQYYVLIVQLVKTHVFANGYLEFKSYYECDVFWFQPNNSQSQAKIFNIKSPTNESNVSIFKLWDG